jgi:hypothetical protein
MKDPFPEISYSIRNLWTLIDHWAFRRIRRLGVPDPWTAWRRGYDAAYAEIELAVTGGTEVKKSEQLTKEAPNGQEINGLL